ncbi:hypothetical protein B7R56_20780 [Pseudomonas savastanoi pv. retacarpa]|uniref:Uncharacterized protein n=1 Tax=Pseudomonas savastanoi pv. nerii TaxID=360921 RepID=A0AB73QGS9_PSESS|nr:hypothetical protein BKM19_021860 [Pseudomonas amygdali pv. morsprunorum]KAA3548666.1 hypothetical protein DXU85_01855 [Pseudomonas savastanoi]OSR26565.1 hypothetical protein B7R56_20780 [Pseudomonas savastanoi pv. retacarpa]PAB35145.1 hypothetical protein CCZ00_08250 [Pseudomonas savastanoi pv. fraxini]PAB39566.1 hypothetical protein CC205_00525 [Pseudomonas savastanoi pv. nerii]
MILSDSAGVLHFTSPDLKASSNRCCSYGSPPCNGGYPVKLRRSSTGGCDELKVMAQRGMF